MKEFLRKSRDWFFILGMFLIGGSIYIDFFKSFEPYIFYLGIFVWLLAIIGYFLGTKPKSKP